MRWFCPMSNERGSVVLSDAELDQARELVIAILDLALADPGKSKAFLKETAFDPSTALTLTKQPEFMLSVLDTAATNEELLGVLESSVGITQALIELTRARLAFHVAAELSRQRNDRTTPVDVGDRARQKLRELSKQGRKREQATKKLFPGSGEL